MFKIINGDSLLELDKLEENSIDAIVTDPPYELGFMNKGWDSTGIAYSVDFWKKCLRVLKPGGHLVSFSSSKTFYRMICAIEDAGFEIRDNLFWFYSQSMPKGQNIGKMLDAKIKYGKSNSVSLRELELSEGVGSYNKVAPNNGMMGEKKVFEKKYYQSENIWSGWNTQLKPAYEPITLARKPLDGTVSENVFKWRVGGLNVNECKVGNEIISTPKAPKVTFAEGELGRGSTREENGSIDYDEHLGRYPSNIISDGCLGDITRFYYCAKASSKDREEGLDGFEEKIGGGMNGTHEQSLLTGSGNIRNNLRKNFHPTVKPTDLMQYLVRLISPKGATILDPFMGSGSTGKAVAFENRERDAKYSFIGIELDEEYCKIAHARIDWANKYKEEIESEVPVDRPKDLIKTNSLW